MSIFKTPIESVQVIEYDYDRPEPDNNFEEQVTVTSVKVYGVEVLASVDKVSMAKLQELCFDDVTNRYVNEILD